MSRTHYEFKISIKKSIYKSYIKPLGLFFIRIFCLIFGLYASLYFSFVPKFQSERNVLVLIMMSVGLISITKISTYLDHN